MNLLKKNFVSINFELNKFNNIVQIKHIWIKNENFWHFDRKNFESIKMTFFFTIFILSSIERF